MGMINPWTWVFMVAFCLLIGLGFLNLLAAIFVDSLLEMKELGAREKLEACMHGAPIWGGHLPPWGTPRRTLPETTPRARNPFL